MMQEKKPTAAAAALLVTALLATGCTSDDPDPTPSAEQGSGGGSADGSGGSAEDLASMEFDVSWTDAVEAAQGAFEGDLISVELERERGDYAYSVELASSTEEFEAIVDPASGELLRERSEKLESDDAAEIAEEIIDPSGLIDPAEAMASATAEADGAVRSWNLDRSWDGVFYEVEVDTGKGDSIEVTVDAETGDAVEVDE